MANTVKVFIPDWWTEVYADQWIPTIKEAMDGLGVSKYETGDASSQGGAYLYLHGSIFPRVGKRDPIPTGELYLSASEGWKVRWCKVSTGNILTLH